MNDLQRKFDEFSYETLKLFIGMVGLVCMIFISWVSFFWSIGAFIHFNFGEGLLALFVSLLSIVTWRGAGEVLEKLGE